MMVSTGKQQPQLMNRSSNLRAFFVVALSFAGGLALLNHAYDAPPHLVSESKARKPNPETIARYALGERLFAENCNSCHKLHKRDGAQWQSLSQRYPDREWLYRWTLNSQALIAEGDPLAVGLFNEYKQTIMPAMEHLTRADIEAIYFYVEASYRGL